MEEFNLIHLMFYPWEKSPGTDSVVACVCPSTTLDIVEKKKTLATVRIQTQDNPARSLITTLTTISQIQITLIT